jgi:PLP dependent protein
MSSVVKNFEKIKLLVNTKVNIIAISKSFQYTHIKPLVDFGHEHFGENKVQEAIVKWAVILKDKPNIKLHMVGKLQSNKAKDAVNLFHYIHSLDNLKLAILLAKYESSLKQKRKYFIQINIGNENQKSGIKVQELNDFYNYCSKDLNLNIVGLMVIPPNDGNVNKYFKYLMELNISLGLKELSMGMSGDFEQAIKFKSTFLRIGTAIFGKRN